MRRCYLTAIVGAGSDADPFRAATAGFGIGHPTVTVDGRADPTASGGVMLVEIEATAAEHTTIAASAGVTPLPLEDEGGAPLQLTDPIRRLAAGARATLRARLDALGVDVDDLTPDLPVRAVVRRIVLRLVLRQRLGADDLPVTLDTELAALDASLRQRVNARLKALGMDPAGDGLTRQSTVRDFLRWVLAQDLPLFHVRLD